MREDHIPTIVLQPLLSLSEGHQTPGSTSNTHRTTWMQKTHGFHYHSIRYEPDRISCPQSPLVLHISRHSMVVRQILEVLPRAHRGSKRHFRECIHSTALRAGLPDTTIDNGWYGPYKLHGQSFTIRVASRHCQTAARKPGFRNLSTILSWQSSKLFLEVNWSIPSCHPVFPGCHVQARQA